MRTLFGAGRELQSSPRVSSAATQTPPPLSPSLSPFSSRPCHSDQASLSPFSSRPCHSESPFSSRPCHSDQLRNRTSVSHKRPHKTPLHHSASFPVTTDRGSGSLFERIRSSQSHRRPLPLTPPQQRSRIQRSSVHHCPGLRDQEDTPLGHGELRRRETVHWFPLLKESESEQEHIYEEIHEETSDESDEELTKEEVSPHSFLSLISLERRRHLRFYGRTDWDYGGERF